jgi:polyhydroxyalkanoate synthase
MPYRMHSEYLRRLFLDNDLAEGRFQVDGHPVAISDIRVHTFVVGTEKDHVAPWQSVYKIKLLTNCQDVTFVLAAGGHNAGIVSEPGHPRRRYRMSTRRGGDPYRDPDTWLRETPAREGSWWPAWASWLAKHSSARTPPPPMGAPEAGCPPLCDAPGTYVFQR